MLLNVPKQQSFNRGFINTCDEIFLFVKDKYYSTVEYT